MPIQSFQDLIVWQKSISLVSSIYKLTSTFPQSQIYSLVNQLQRCVVSIPSNIAEGYQRHSRKEYLQFLYISFGSCAELRTQLIISEKLGFVRKQDYDEIISQLVEVEKMLFVLISKMKKDQ